MIDVLSPTYYIYLIGTFTIFQKIFNPVRSARLIFLIKDFGTYLQILHVFFLFLCIMYLIYINFTKGYKISKANYGLLNSSKTEKIGFFFRFFGYFLEELKTP